jgi:SHAQKYF class myb-like DNA-binding protein
VSSLARQPSTRKKEKKDRKKSSASNSGAEAKPKNGRWSIMEHVRFLEALKSYGKNWKKVEEHVATRTSTQARSHA